MPDTNGPDTSGYDKSGCDKSGPSVTDDPLFQGHLRLLQPASGHRAGTDAVLLAAATPPLCRRIADLGSATGVVGLRAAQLNPDAKVTLIEREPALVALARENIDRNVLTGRVCVHQGDVFRLGGEAGLREAFDCVLSNPPFLNPGESRPSSDPARARAHVLEGALTDWVKNAVTILAPKGQFILIHRADALGEILAAMARRLGDLRLRFVHPEEAAPAIRVLVQGRKGSRGPMKILPALVLNKAGGGFAPEPAALHAGTARSPMDGFRTKRAGKPARFVWCLPRSDQ